MDPFGIAMTSETSKFYGKDGVTLYVIYNMYIQIYVYIYIYTHNERGIKRERERETER